MDYTPTFRLHLPDFDYEPWDGDVNGNFEVIDAALSTITSIPGFAGIWTNSTAYAVGQTLLDPTDGSFWTAQISHTSAAVPTTFATDRANHPSYWIEIVNSAQYYAEAAEAAWQQFHSTWYGPSATQPALDPYGNPPTAGDVYFDTSMQQLLTWTGSDWMGSTSEVVVSENPPASATQGELWWDSSTIGLFIYYGGQWVETSGNLMSGGTITGDLTVTGTLTMGVLNVTSATYSTITATTANITGSAYITSLGKSVNGNGYNITNLGTVTATAVTATGAITAGSLVSTGGTYLAPLQQDLNANSHSISNINTIAASSGAVTSLSTGSISTGSLVSTSGSWLAPLQQNLNANGYNITSVGTIVATNASFSQVVAQNVQSTVGSYLAPLQQDLSANGYNVTNVNTLAAVAGAITNCSFTSIVTAGGNCTGDFYIYGNLYLHGATIPYAGAPLTTETIDVVAEIVQLRSRIAALEARE